MVIGEILIAAGDGDCELFRSAGLLQPVNAVTSLSFSVAGLVILWWAGKATEHERLLRVIFGVAMVLTGFGSFLFHGFDNALAQFSHDVTFLTTVWILAVINVAEARGWDRRIGWGIVALGAAAFSIALVIGPTITNILTLLVTIALVASDVALERTGGIARPLWLTSLASLVVAVVFFVLGRTDGGWCDPAGWFQGHGLWHIFSALALTLYFVATSRSRQIRSVSL